MNNLDASEWLDLWAIKLDEFDVQHRPRTTIKAQTLADFIVEFTIGKDEEEKLMAWMIWTNSSSNQRVERARVVLRSPKGDTIECVVHFQFSTTNNEVEYEAVLSSLDLAKVTGVEAAVIHSDSQVVVGHINGDYEAKGE